MAGKRAGKDTHLVGKSTKLAALFHFHPHSDLEPLEIRCIYHMVPTTSLASQWGGRTRILDGLTTSTVAQRKIMYLNTALIIQTKNFNHQFNIDKQCHPDKKLAKYSVPEPDQPRPSYAPPQSSLLPLAYGGWMFTYLNCLGLIMRRFWCWIWWRREERELVRIQNTRVVPWQKIFLCVNRRDLNQYHNISYSDPQNLFNCRLHPQQDKIILNMRMTIAVKHQLIIQDE